jgi:hypothetical protein
MLNTLLHKTVGVLMSGDKILVEQVAGENSIRRKEGRRRKMEI